MSSGRRSIPHRSKSWNIPCANKHDDQEKEDEWAHIINESRNRNLETQPMMETAVLGVSLRDMVSNNEVNRCKQTNKLKK